MDTRSSLESETNHTSQQDAIYRAFRMSDLSVPSQPLPEHPTEFTPNTLNTYNFTTENLAGFVPKLNLADKKVLSIAGSGDFPICAYTFGAKTVTAVDVMPTACFYGELKFAALKKFNLDEFLTFFATNSNATYGPSSFAYQMYEQIREQLSETARKFFDKLITPEGNNEFLSPGKMLIDKIGHMGEIRAMSYYLASKENYQQAQDRVKPTLFYPQPIDQFLASPTAKPNSFNLIYLSNIPTTLC